MPAKKTKTKTKTVSENAFAGQARQPSDREQASLLGGSRSLLQSLAAGLQRDLKLDREEWNSYSVSTGWSLRMQSKKRKIVDFGPRAGYFLAAFVLGEKAVAAARKSKLPTGILKMIDEAKRYPQRKRRSHRSARCCGCRPRETLATIKFEN